MPTTVTYPDCPCCGSGSGSGSGSGLIQTTCCANPLPQTLYLTGGGLMSGLVAIPLIYVGIRATADTGSPLQWETWIATGSFSCGYTKIVFQCQGGAYNIYWQGTINNPSSSAVATTCSPFLVTNSSLGIPVGTCGSGSYSWTVTQ